MFTHSFAFTSSTFHAARLLRRRAAAAFILLGASACQPPPPAQPEEAAVAQPPATDEPASSDELSQEDLPPAEQVLEKAVVAIGGRDVIDSIESYYSESKMEVPSQNISASTKVWWKKGNFYSETDMPGIGTTRVWRNEEGVWSEDPINGSRKVEGKEARQTEWGTTLALVAEWKRFFSSAETTGRRRHEDMTLVDVRLSNDEGDQITLSFDGEGGLLRQQLFEQESPMGVMPVTVTFEDYETHGGLKQASRSVANMAVIEAVTTSVKFEVNPEIDDAKFEVEPPAKPQKKPKK